MDNSYNTDKWIRHFCNQKNYNLYINSINYNRKIKRNPNTRLNKQKIKSITKIQKEHANLLLYFSKNIQIKN